VGIRWQWRNLLAVKGVVGEVARSAAATLSPFKSHAPPPGIFNQEEAVGFSLKDDEEEESSSRRAPHRLKPDETQGYEKKIRLTRVSHWENKVSIDTIHDDMKAGCRCGRSCVKHLTVAMVERRRTDNSARDSAEMKARARSEILCFRKNEVIYV